MTRQGLFMFLIAGLLAWGPGDLVIPFDGAGQAQARDGGRDGSGKEDGGKEDGGKEDGGKEDDDRDDGDDNSGKEDGGKDPDKDATRGKDQTGGKDGRGRKSRPGLDGGADLPWPPGLWRLLHDGSSEYLTADRYERRDSRGRIRETRRATAGDRDRLAASPRAGAVELRIEIAGDRLTAIDSAGWREELRRGRYRLTDPRGNLVTDRPATAADLDRIGQTLRR